MPPPPAAFLDIILYSREQIRKENAAQGNADRPEQAHAPWGIISVKAQDVDHELPMQVRPKKGGSEEGKREVGLISPGPDSLSDSCSLHKPANSPLPCCGTRWGASTAARVCRSTRPSTRRAWTFGPSTPSSGDAAADGQSVVDTLAQQRRQKKGTRKNKESKSKPKRRLFLLLASSAVGFTWGHRRVPYYCSLL